jgi:hypothetical protein
MQYMSANNYQLEFLSKENLPLSEHKILNQTAESPLKLNKTEIQALLQKQGSALKINRGGSQQTSIS